MFGLNGIGGMLIAVVLLLSIVGFLGTNALLVQQKNASNYYKIDGEKELQMKDKEATKRVVDAK
jgi:hypothetical protein